MAKSGTDGERSEDWVPESRIPVWHVETCGTVMLFFIQLIESATYIRESTLPAAFSAGLRPRERRTRSVRRATTGLAANFCKSKEAVGVKPHFKATTVPSPFAIVPYSVYMCGIEGGHTTRNFPGDTRGSGWRAVGPRKMVNE